MTDLLKASSILLAGVFLSATPFLHVSANPYYAGAAAQPADSGGGLTMTDTGAFAGDDYAGYILKNVTTGRASMISSHTDDTITFLDDIGYDTPALVFSGGDSYRINKVDKILDMPSLGKGDLIDTLGTATAANQVIEGIYQWGNDLNGGTDNAEFAISTPLLVENTHYFNSAKPGYTALSYPHPLRDGLPAAAGTLTTETLNVDP